jgi:DNA invertase Pin-like site-specific DNA recombinase
MVELFDAKGVSFVAVTQKFNTTTSIGRLTLNVLLSFAQFEREVIGERIRDKVAAKIAELTRRFWRRHFFRRKISTGTNNTVTSH